MTNPDWEKLTFGNSHDSIHELLDDLRPIADDVEAVVVVLLFKSGLRDILGHWRNDETAVGMLEFAANDLLRDSEDEDED